jgi:hypothetical protein
MTELKDQMQKEECDQSMSRTEPVAQPRLLTPEELRAVAGGSAAWD